MTAPLPFNEIERLACLRSYEALDTPTEASFDDLAQIAARVFGTPMAFVTLIDENRMWFKSRIGLEIDEIDRDQALCSYTILGHTSMIVPDARLDPRFADGPLVTDLGLRFYAGAPLLTDDGFALGSLCVIDKVPHTPTPEQLETLTALAAQVVSQFELRRTNRRLQEALAEAEAVQVRLRRKQKAITTIAEIGRKTLAELDVARIAQTLVDAGRHVVDGTWATFVYGDASTDRVAFASLPTVELPNDREAHAYVWDLLREGRVIRRGDGPTGETLYQDAGSLLGVPVVSPEGQTLGGFLVGHPERDHFTPGSEEIMKLLASQAAVALANVTLVDRLRGESEERLAAEIEARLAKTQTDEVLAAIGSILIVLDDQGLVRRWNASATRQFGIEADAAIGRSLSEIDVPWPTREIIEIADTVRQEGRSRRLDDVLVSAPNGVRRLLGLSMTPLNGGENPGVLILGADITARREAEVALQEKERQYRSVVGNVSDVIFQIDGEGRWSLLNPAWTSVTGFSVEESIGRPFYDFMPSERREWAERGFLRHMAGEFTDVDEPMLFLHRDGGLRWVQLRAQIIFDEAGQATGSTGTMHDVTDRHLAQAAEESRREFEQFITNLSTQFINLSSNEMGDAIEEALYTVSLLVGLDRSAVVLLSDSGDQYRVAHEWVGGRLDARKGKYGWETLKTLPWLAQSLRTNQSLFITNGKHLSFEQSSERDFLLSQGWGAVACLPMASRGEFFGWVTFVYAKPVEEWPETTAALLKMVVDIFANALFRLKTEDEMRRLSAIALAETESRLQSIVTSAPIALFSLDADGVFTLSDGRGLRALDLDAGQMVGLYAEDVFQDLPHVLATLRRALTGAAFVEELAIADLCFESHFCPLSDDAGRFAGTIGVLIDITERKALETQLRHAQKIESIGHLAAGIAHEINSPIQFVSDNLRFLTDAWRDTTRLAAPADLLLTAGRSDTETQATAAEYDRIAQEIEIDYLREEVPRALEQSLDGLGRVTQIVRAMKEFSHPGTVDKVPVDLNRAIESTLTVCRNEWRYVAEMVTEFDPELPPVVCLPGDVNQAVLNLVVNAAHALEEVSRSEGERGQITVSTRAMGDEVEIRVRDNGPGIPPAIRSKVFDPFFTTKQVGRGTGQGLAIVHGIIVKRHGGSVSMETEVGQGTSFILRFPRSPHQAHAEAA